MKKQLTYANNNKIPYVAMVMQEWDERQYNYLKEYEIGKQKSVSLEEIKEIIKRWHANLSNKDIRKVKKNA